MVAISAYIDYTIEWWKTENMKETNLIGITKVFQFFPDFAIAYCELILLRVQ